MMELNIMVRGQPQEKSSASKEFILLKQFTQILIIQCFRKDGSHWQYRKYHIILIIV